MLRNPKTMCSMVLEYVPTLARTNLPSFVGEYAIHGAHGKTACILYSSMQQCPFGKNSGAGDWYTISNHYLLQGRARQTPLLINQPMGKGHP